MKNTLLEWICMGDLTRMLRLRASEYAEKIGQLVIKVSGSPPLP